MDNTFELRVEKITPKGRIGVCIDAEGTSSWWVVRPDGSSDSGVIRISPHFQHEIDRIIEQ